MAKIIISPSILSADFGQLNEEIQTIESSADWLHIDVMDGHFVSNITFGPDVVRSVRTRLFKDCHLMVSEPEKYLDAFIAAGADGISFHIESKGDVTSLINEIKSHGVKAGIALKPGTLPVEVFPYLNMVDYVLVMSVEPGLGGQKFMPEALDKIREFKKYKSGLMIQVDGGINDVTAPSAIKAGASNLVAGSYIFGKADRMAAIKSLINEAYE